MSRRGKSCQSQQSLEDVSQRNSASSRSHCIFNFVLLKRESADGVESEQRASRLACHELRSCLHFPSLHTAESFAYTRFKLELEASIL